MMLFIGKLFTGICKTKDEEIINQFQLRLYNKNKKIYECEIISIDKDIWACELSLKKIERLHKVLESYINEKE